MYLRNIGAPSGNHCCSGKAVSGTHPGCVFVALSIHHAIRMLHIDVCGLPKSTIFFHVVS